MVVAFGVALGHVFDVAGAETEIEQAQVAGDRRGDGVEAVAVTADAPEDVGRQEEHDANADDSGLTRVQVSGEIAVVMFAIGRGHEQLDVLANQFVGAVGENALCGGVSRLDDAALIDGDDSVNRGVENGLESGIAIVQALAGPFELVTVCGRRRIVERTR